MAMRVKIFCAASACIFFACLLGAGEVPESEKKKPPKKTVSRPLPHGGEFIDPAERPNYKRAARIKEEEKKAKEDEEKAAKAALDRKKVDAAIKKGVAFLVSKQLKNGSFDGPYAQSYPMGYTALVTLTLLKCGVPAGHPVIVKAFKYLSELQYKKVYSVGLLLMALEAKYYNPRRLEKFIKKQEKKDLSTTTASKYGDFKPRILPADRMWASVLAKWLVDVQASTGAWTYAEPSTPKKKSKDDKPEPRTDNSNTQYAVLGLKAARRLGIVIPPEVFMKNLVFFLDTQCGRENEKVSSFTIPAAHLDSFEYKKSLDSAGWSDPSREEFAARGWDYTVRFAADGKERSTTFRGSMVTAGLASVIICKSELLKYKRFTRKLKEKTNIAIEDGCAWLVKYYSVKGNPSSLENWKPRQGMAHHYYYLYGLERAGSLSGVRMLGGHVWYKVGVLELLAMQREEGSWAKYTADPNPKPPNDLTQTCFALLFLKRATIGVIDSEIIYTGDGIIWKKGKKKAEEEKDKSVPGNKAHDKLGP